MSNSIRCFWLEPAGLIRLSLRRYSDGGPCPLMPGEWSHHDAEVFLAEVPELRTAEGYVAAAESAAAAAGLQIPRRDSGSWPERCGCGHPFAEQDRWQLFSDSVYRRADTGELTTLRTAPAGAMWDASWMGEHFKGPDGLHLVVKTPAGEWLVDGTATNGPGWKRTGTPPNVTATPSIGIHRKGGGWAYHGWLKAGVLEEC